MNEGTAIQEWDGETRELRPALVISGMMTMMMMVIAPPSDWTGKNVQLSNIPRTGNDNATSDSSIHTPGSMTTVCTRILVINFANYSNRRLAVGLKLKFKVHRIRT